MTKIKKPEGAEGRKFFSARHAAVVVVVLVLIGTAFFISKRVRNAANDGILALKESAGDVFSSAISGDTTKNFVLDEGGMSSDTPIAQSSSAISSTVPPEASDQSASPESAEFSAQTSGEENNISANQSSAPPAAGAPSCSFPSSTSAPVSASLGKIILNEIAWMGSPAAPGETASDAGKEEWIELKNISSLSIPLSGWQVLDASGKVKIIFGDEDALSSGSFFILFRASSSFATANAPATVLKKNYSGGLVNAGDDIAIMNSSCDVSDVIFASGGWPGGNNTTKQTLERDADGAAWHASVAPGGTPGKENSVPLIAPTSSSSSASVSPSPISSSSSVVTSVPPVFYDATIAFSGDGSGTIDAGENALHCAATCTGTYSSGTILSFAPHAASGSIFVGWASPCYGATVCSITLNARAFLIATFRRINVVAVPSSPPAATGDSDTQSNSTNSSSTPAPLPQPSSPSHLLIAALQIAGASSTNDFIRIFNPTAETVDLSGWKLRKRAKTGSEDSIRQFSSGSAIAPGHYFVWANSENDFSDSVNADASSTASLAVDNSVALLNASGTVLDAVAWGTGANHSLKAILIRQIRRQIKS